MMHGRVGWARVIVALCGVGCAGSSGEPAERRALRSLERPPGWEADSHEPRERADYERVFDVSRVHRIDIEISPEAHQRMIDDLIARVGSSPASSRSPLSIAACAGRSENEACSFVDVEGLCTPAGALLACEAYDQLGPLDLVPGDPIEVPVTVRYDGATWNRVAMRYKGNSSLSSPFRSGRRKLPFRFDFDQFEDDHPELENQRFFGFDELTFASAYSDASLVREAVSAEVLRASGLKVARWAFYRVYVDRGEGPVYWGLYTMIEDPSDQMIASQFPDPSGNLYKPDGEGAAFAEFDPKSFDKKTHEKEADYGDVLRVFSALHAPRDDAAAWRRELEAALDVDSFLRTLAVTRAIDHWDGYGENPHNYYLYGDPTQDGRLVWISWDHNLTFAPGRGRTSTYLERTSPRWPLIHFLLADPVYRARYVGMLEEALRGPLEKGRFDALVERLHALIAPHVVGPEGEQLPYTNLRNPQTFVSALPGLIAAGDARRAVIGQALLREAGAGQPGEREPEDPPPAEGSESASEEASAERASDEPASEERGSEEWASEERGSEEWASDERASEERASEERASEEWASDGDS